jgi:hypothetical protein
MDALQIHDNVYIGTNRDSVQHCRVLLRKFCVLVFWGGGWKYLSNGGCRARGIMAIHHHWEIQYLFEVRW